MESSALPTGTVTFLYTDVEGSTELAQQYPAEWADLLAQHDAILRTSIEECGGHIFRFVGDGFCAAFPTAVDALQAAIHAQHRLQGSDWQPAALKVRMGIHTGPAQAGNLEDLSEAYTGYLTLTRAQRVMSTAYGDQVLLSSAAAELLNGNRPDEVELRDMGEHRLKGLLNLEHLWQASAPGLRSEFPALQTLNAIPNNLPVQLNSFIGRERELKQTKELLESAHLLTLIGPGGTGKTRLGLQLAVEALPDFPEGVWLVELAPLTDPALVLQTIAATLGIRELPGAVLKDLVTEYLRSKRTMLLLDNCEHLVEACAILADHFLHHCPSLKIVASSREALGISGETIYRVPPLGLPESNSQKIETLRGSEAVQLFVDRATAVKPGFSLNERNASAVAQVCQRLDGIPLALELAAARLEMLTPQQIATRLDDRFRLLTGGSRTALPRQQTLRSLIDWSYDLLSEPERLLFCRMAVFVGGWSLEAAEAVCPDMYVLDLLSQLVQKSLVAAEEQGEGASTRFRLLETIRQYARDRLFEMEDAVQVRGRHLDYYLQFAEGGEFQFFGPNRQDWVEQCDLELDNFRSALQWGLEYNVEAALRLSGALVSFWPVHGIAKEGRRWLQAARDQAMALPLPSGEAGGRRQAALAKCLSGLAQISYGDGDYLAGFTASQETVRLYRHLGDRDALAFSLVNQGNMAAFLGDIQFAEQAMQEGLKLAQEVGNKTTQSYALGVLCRYVAIPRGDLATARLYAAESTRLAREIGMTWAVAQSGIVFASIERISGNLEAARRYCAASIEISQDLGDLLQLNEAYTELGDIELYAGNLEEARRYYQQSIVVWKEVGHRALSIHVLESFAFIAGAQNQPDRAARLLGAAEGLRESLGISELGVERLQSVYDRTLSILKAQMDETAFNARWSEGCGMSMDAAISYALEA